jgi:hypothetical protein
MCKFIDECRTSLVLKGGGFRASVFTSLAQILLRASLVLALAPTAYATSSNPSTSGTGANLPTPSSPPEATQQPRLSPSLDPVARRIALVGRWYGETKTEKGDRLRWLTDREANGTYRTQYVTSSDEGEGSIEIGQWGLSGSVLFTIQRAWIRNGDTQRADAANVYSYDAYDLLSLSENRLEYRSAGSGKHFVVRRVQSSFELRP